MAESTKFQANFKLADGTLINVYADNSADFEAQLTSTQDMAALIHSVSQSLGSAGPARSFSSNRSYTPRPEAQPTTPTAPATNPEDQKPSCKHGLMTYRTGTSAKGPWQGWMCPAPKGTPDQCKPVFVR
jgi:hypothetical protein